MDFLTSYIDFLRYPPTKWYFVTATVLIAICFYIAKHRFSTHGSQSIFNFLFPSKIYLHRSTKTDLKYLLLLPVVSLLLFAPAISFFFSMVAHVKELTESLLIFVFGSAVYTVPANGLPGIGNMLLFTLLFAMVADFGFYLHHLAFHKIPFLWEFHKVHHSAEVLTPLTDFRAHPLEILTYGLCTGATLGLAQGIFGYMSSPEPSVLMIGGMNAVFFFYYLSGYTLRHSHIWISYGSVLSKILISPAQHQIHHSSAEKHWDKIFGGAFALWDWFFGTLYIPIKKEELNFGIDNDTEKYSTAFQLFVRPIQVNFYASRLSTFITSVVIFVFLLFALRAFF